MNVLIVGGFLGSGKTTLVRGLIEALQARAAGVAIIENEAGRVGLDARLLAQSQVHVTEMYGGCLCCQYSGSLLPAVETIRESFAPEWLIIELTGLALLPGVMEAFHTAAQAYHITGVCVVDASRWDRLRLATGDMLFEQARGASAVFLNKTDAASGTAAIETELGEKLPRAKIFKGSLREGIPTDLLEQILPK